MRITAKAWAAVTLLLGVAAAMAGTITYTYDNIGQLMEAEWSHSGTGTVTRSYTHTPARSVLRINMLADTDGDGLPDAWEIAMFGDLTTSDGTGDQDNDGMTDYEEWLAGMDPTNDESSLSHGEFTATTNSVTIAWASASNRTYKIDHTTNLLDGFTATLATGIEGTPETNTWTHSTTNRVNFYRVTQEDE